MPCRTSFFAIPLVAILLALTAAGAWAGPAEPAPSDAPPAPEALGRPADPSDPVAPDAPPTDQQPGPAGEPSDPIPPDLPLVGEARATLAPEGYSIWEVNVINNGSADWATGSADGSVVADMPWWQRSSPRMTAVQYGSPNFPAAAANMCGNPGANFLAGGPEGSPANMYQEVDTSSITAAIDTGGVTFDATGCLGGYGSQRDTMGMTITFLSGSGSSLGQITLGPVSAADRGNQTRLLQRARSGVVPRGTRRIRTSLTAVRLDGTYNDGYADNLSLVLHKLKTYLPAVRTSALPPQAPSGLACSAAGTGQINLAWTDNANNEAGFKVEQAVGAGAFAQIATTGANAVQKQVTGLAPDTEYRYRVRAYSGSGDSAYSNVCTARTNPVGPTTTRVTNRASYPVVFLTIDGVQYLPASPMGILPGGSMDIQVAAGIHDLVASTGHWNDYGQRVLYYTYTFRYDQQAGAVGNIYVDDIAVSQLLTQFGTTGFWDGYYFDASYNYHTAAFLFDDQGHFNYYVDGYLQKTGTYSLEGRDPSQYMVYFRASNGGDFNYVGSLYELGAQFYMRNGPPSWNQITYQYQGHNLPSSAESPAGE